MTALEAISLVVTALVVPYIVALIRGGAISGEKARWLAIAASLVAGAVAGFVGGIPATPESWLLCLFAAVGGTQAAYTVFRSAGVTSRWLNALMELKVTGKEGGSDD